MSEKTTNDRQYEPADWLFETTNRTMITDTDRINALEKMGNVAVWHGYWAMHVPEKGGKQICGISELDENGTEVGEEFAHGETIREAIDNYLANSHDESMQNQTDTNQRNENRNMPEMQHPNP